MHFENSIDRRQILVATLAVVTCVVSSSSARAYRTVADQPALAGRGPIAWHQSEVVLTVPTESKRPADVLAAVGSFDTALAALACASVRVTARLATQPVDLANHLGDGQSSILLVGPEWTTVLGLPADRMASTELLYASEGGSALRIVEADVLINADRFVYYLDVAPNDVLARDLRAVVHHELGHALGLAHPCETSPTGDGAPACSDVSGAASSMMYPDYTGPAQQFFDPDDSSGICSLYPARTCAQTCPASTACGPGGECLALCRNVQCNAGEQCVEGACRAPCADALCSEGDACVEGQCRALCGGRTCEAGTVCDGSQCVASCFGAPCASRACDVNRPCPTGLDCDGGACRTQPNVVNSPCRSDRDCDDASAICRYGACVLHTARVGDVCADDAACASRICRAGSCRDACATECTSGECVRDVSVAYCDPSRDRRLLGAECASGRDCISSICLAVDSAPRVCSRDCDVAADDCPRGFSCEHTRQNDAVCVPSALADTGCSVRGRASSGDAALFFLVLAIPIVLRSRRRVMTP